MKKKVAALVTVGLISVSGVLVFANNNNSSANEYDPSLNGGCIDLSNVQGEIDTNAIAIGVRGIVKDITIDGGVTIIRVEGTIEDDTKYDIADVVVDKDTIITKDDSSTLLEVSDIKEGQTLEVVFQGPEGRSYPVMVNAYSVRIIN